MTACKGGQFWGAVQLARSSAALAIGFGSESLAIVARQLVGLPGREQGSWHGCISVGRFAVVIPMTRAPTSEGHAHATCMTMQVGLGNDMLMIHIF